MTKKKATDGPYIVWLDFGYDGWSPESYATLKEALEAPRYDSDYVITRKCEYEISEK